MAMFILVLVATLLIFRGYGDSTDVTVEEEAMNNEFLHSLKKNIYDACKWKESDGYEIPLEPSDTLLVSKHFPTEMELDKFQAMPSTLTKANYNYYNISNNDHNNKWASETNIQHQAVYDHPVQNRSFCYSLVKLAGHEGVLDLYNHFRTPNRGHYLIRKRNGVIGAHGSARFECGYYQGKEGCETRLLDKPWYYDKCSKILIENNAKWSDAFDHLVDFDTRNNAINSLVNCSTDWELYKPQFDAIDKRLLYKHHFHKRVFVIATQWDYNYHHFVADSLIRLIRHIKFLRANPDVFIHIRSMELYDIQQPFRSAQFKKNAKHMRTQFFQLLGIDPRRIIHDIVFAEEVFIPRAAQCGYSLSSPIEMRLLAKQLLRGAEQAKLNLTRLIGTNQQSTRTKVTKTGPKKKNLIIQQRFSLYQSERYWTNQTFDIVVKAFTKAYPNHNIIRMSSLQSEGSSLCLSCEIQLYRDADVLVGLHGAGLTNLMFMPPGSMVVEFVGHWVNVHAPVCGYYGPFGAIFGHHHYLHGYKNLQPIRADEAANRSAAFFNAINRNQRHTLNITTVPYYEFQYPKKYDET